jgi:hypothetical protein
MSKTPNEQSALDADLEREIREGRKFNPQEAIARMAGSGAMKGASPVSRERQAEIEIASWLGSHVSDDTGALKKVLHRQLKGSPFLLGHLDRPLVALAACCTRVLKSEELLKDLVREADVEWGRVMDERPYFDRDSSPNPDDPYTAKSVREQLRRIVEQLTA